MALSAFTLVGTVEAKTSQAEAGLKRVDHAAQRLHSQFAKPLPDPFRKLNSSGGGSAFAALLGANVATVGLTALTAALGVGGRAVLDYSGRLEQLKIGFGTLLGSTQAASAHLKELEQFAAKTPFEFEQVAKASQRFHNMGLETKKVIPLLSAVGDAVAAAGGNSESIDRVSLALSQMIAKGKVSAEEMNQLAEAGVGGWRILEQQLGITKAEAVKLAEQGQISAETFVDAFQKFSKVNFGGAMEKQSRTFQGAMSTIKDTLLTTASTAFEPMFKKISEITDRISQEMQKGKPTLEHSVRALLEGLGEVVAESGVFLGEQIAKGIADGISNFSFNPAALLKRMAPIHYGVVQGLLNNIKNAAGVNDPTGPLTSPVAVPDLKAPLPPTKALQSGLSSTNDVAEKTADILESVRERLFSVGDASVYAATKQKLLRAGVTDLNDGYAALALRLASAADAAQQSADRQLAEQGRIFDRNQDIASQMMALAAQANDEIAELAASSRGGRSAVEKFEQGLAILAEQAGMTAEQIANLKTILANLDTSRADEKARAESESLKRLRGELSNTLKGMEHDLMRGPNTDALHQLQDRLESISELKLQPGALDSFFEQFRRAPDAVSAAEALSYALTALSGAAGTLGPDAEKVAAFFVKLARGTSDAMQLNKLNEQTARYKELMGDLNQVMGVGINLTERERVEKLLLTDAYNQLSNAQKNNLRLAASQADAHLQRIKETEELRDHLSSLANDITGIFDNTGQKLFTEGWKSAFREVGLGFADMLRDMANELMRSTVLKLLEKAAGIEPDPNARTGILEGLLQKAGILKKPKAAETLAANAKSPVIPDNQAATQAITTATKDAGARITEKVSTSTEQLNSATQTQTERLIQALNTLAEHICQCSQPAQQSAASEEFAALAAVEASRKKMESARDAYEAAKGARGKSTVTVRDDTGEILPGGANDQGTMPPSNSGQPAEATDQTPVVNSVNQAADKITSGQQAQTAQLSQAINSSADRIIDGLTPRQEGFLSGLAKAALNGAVQGAIGAATGGALTGGLLGGATSGGTVTSTVSDPSTGETLPGGGATRPRMVTPRRARGGPISAGRTYLIGEEGPELARFGSSGTILPNNHPATQMALNGGQGGRATTQNFHFTMQIHATDAQSIKRSRGQIERQMASSLRHTGSRMAA